MPYPSRARQEDTNAESRSTAPAAPSTARMVSPQMPSTRGGAPKVKNSLAYRWRGAADAGGSGGRIPTPAAMTLPQAQQELKDFSQRIRASLEARAKAASPGQMAQSRFWRMYQQYPEQAATLVARRIWTDQMVGKGSVADWMTFIEGR